MEQEEDAGAFRDDLEFAHAIWHAEAVAAHRVRDAEAQAHSLDPDQEDLGPSSLAEEAPPPPPLDAMVETYSSGLAEVGRIGPMGTEAMVMDHMEEDWELDLLEDGSSARFLQEPQRLSSSAPALRMQEVGMDTDHGGTEKDDAPMALD